MALITLQYRSEALRMATTVDVILPECGRLGPDGCCKTLYLYHGLSDDQSSWRRYTSIERYAAKYGIAVVMPSVERSWYTDMAMGNYFTFVTEELPRVCRSYFRCMTERREDTFVAGESMGGYGAMKAALLCPETFGGCIALSGSYDVTRKNRNRSETIFREWQTIFGAYPAELEGSEFDLFAAANRRAEEGTELPRMYLWCGTEDHLLEVSRRFHTHLEQLKIPHAYSESEGDHSWKWWDLQIQKALDWMFSEESADSTENKA